MSQAGGTNSAEVGSINVAVGSDLTGLRSGLRQAEAEAKAAAPKIAAAAAVPMAGPFGSKAGAFAGAGGGAVVAGGGIAGVGRSLRSLTQPIRTFLSGITSITSIFLRLSGIIGLVVTSLAGMVTIVQAIRNGVNGIDSATQRATERIAKLREEFTEETVEAAKKLGLPVGFSPEKLKELEDSVHASRLGLQRQMAALGVAGYSELLRFRDELSKPQGFTPPKIVEQERMAVKALIKALEEVQDQEANLNALQRARLTLAQKTKAVTEEEVGARLRLNRAQEQGRFGAERTAADISRMVTLLETIARQRGR